VAFLDAPTSKPCPNTANKVLFDGFYYATAEFLDVESTATAGCDFDYNQPMPNCWELVTYSDNIASNLVPYHGWDTWMVLVINPENPTKGIALCGSNYPSCNTFGTFLNVYNDDLNRNIGTPEIRVHDACPMVFLMRKAA
jgi:hypothetical protein